MNLATLATIALFVAGGSLAWVADGRAVSWWSPASPVRLTVVVYAVLYGVGSVVLAATGESAGAGPILAGAGMLGFGIGAQGGAAIWGRAGAMAHPPIDGRLAPVAVAAMCAVGVVALVTLVARNGVPLLAEDPLQSRAGFGGIALDLFRWLVPPAGLVAFGLALSRGGLWWLIAAAVCGAIGVVEVSLASRALPFELAIAAIMMVLWSGRRIPWRLWALGGVVAAALFVGVQLARVGPGGGFSGLADVVSFAINRSVDRVLLIHPRTIDVTVVSFPDDEPFLLGGSYVRWLDGALGRDSEPALGYRLYDLMFPGQPGGFAAPGLLAEGWANAGPLLALGLMLSLGVLAQAAGRWFATLPAGAADRAMAALLSVAFARTYATSLLGFALTAAVTIAWWLVATGRIPGRPVRGD